MLFQPYYQYLTGLGEREWNELTPEQHRELIRASRQRKVVTPPDVEQDEDKTFVMDERVAFQIRLVSFEELASMPVYQKF